VVARPSLLLSRPPPPPPPPVPSPPSPLAPPPYSVPPIPSPPYSPLTPSRRLSAAPAAPVRPCATLGPTHPPTSLPRQAHSAPAQMWRSPCVRRCTRVPVQMWAGLSADVRPVPGPMWPGFQVSFTGSTAVGKEIVKARAPLRMLARCMLHLGILCCSNSRRTSRSFRSNWAEMHR
jgi:hypothetical protein